ncbi:MAG: HD domain-containing phosphohydrolase [Chloroflexota bacterium]
MFQFISSLRVRVLLIILLAILPALAIFYFSNQEGRNNEIAHLKRNTVELAEIIALQEADLLDGTRQLLLATSLLTEIREYEKGECSQILSTLLDNNNRYVNLGVANAKGEVVCSALPLTEKVNIADRQYFIKAFTSQEFSIGAFQQERITHRPAINLGYPVYDNTGKPTGVIFATLDLNRFAQLEERLSSKLPAGAILTKVDRNGIVVVRVPNGENLIGSQAPETSVVAEALKANEGVVQATGIDGRPWVYAFVTIKSNIFHDDLHLILGQPQETLLANANHVFNRNLVIMIAVGIFLLTSTWYIFDLSFMRQIRSLLHVTQSLTKGDLEARYSHLPYGASEINHLGVSFNQMAISLEQRQRDLLEAYDTTIEGWSRALDLRDKETEGHTLRVTEMTVALARKAGIPENEIVHIRRGALLHDIGKMGIPDSILLKPDKLTVDEWAIMRKHPMFAYELLYPIEFLRPALSIPYCHHEKWDGTGYPQGLKGEQIPLPARLFAVVDVWDALSYDRPYRKAWSQEKVIEYICEQSGSHFDPKVVEWFLQILSRDEQGTIRH